ncbi:hypothetical protein [Kordia sp.]|uniref:hypothetical protein n=1 Tax=Kordia sp. TaxID=1965332 RepID=UPI003B5B6E82
MSKYIIVIFLCLLGVSCKTVSVNKQPQILTETSVELGSIGLLNGTLIAHTYESIAIPTFEKELKLSVQSVSFSKQTFKAFARANERTQKVALNFSDSLKVKPTYALLQFVDRVAITDELNNTKNTGVRSYLEHKKDAQMVTSISVAFSEKQLNQLKKATEVFLVQSPSKKFSLQLTNLNGEKQLLDFSDGVVFTYQTSSFCWKENNRHKLVIADIVSDSEGCPPNTHRKSEKAIQKNDLFKL